MLLNDMAIFYAIATTRSVSKAALRLKVSKSFVSKSLTKLELELGTKLITRNTRQLQLTQAGNVFLESCTKVVQEQELAQNKLERLRHSEDGHLKISLPVAFALELLVPMLTEFARRYPKISLDLRLEHELVDIIGEGYDLVLRSATLDSSNLIQQKIYPTKQILCATPAYFKQHGMPNIPEDLAKHYLGCYYPITVLTFVKGKQTKTLKVAPQFSSNNLDMIKEFVLKNLSIGYFPEFVVQTELTKKMLVPCLPDYQSPISTIYALYPEQKLMSPALKNFLHMLKAFFNEKHHLE